MDWITNQEKKIAYGPARTETGAISKTFMTNVFLWMFFGLAVTAVISYLFATDAELTGLLYKTSSYGTSITLLGWVVFLAPLGFVLLMSFGFHKLSANVLTVLFVVFSILMGMSLSSVFMVYELGSIYTTFFVTSGMFGIMAFLGYTTKTDLTKLGSLLFMALIGLVIAMLVNYFMKSPAFDYVISFFGVVIFTGLTAYDVQALKRIGAGIEYTDYDSTRKLVILGAVRLYLDFINLFLFLLRFLGNRR